MVAEVVHGAPYRFKDPARFSLAHGGKDRHPYPVPIKVYDETIRVLKSAVQKAKLGRDEEVYGIKRLDDQARQLEKTATGPSFEAYLSRERTNSSTFGGRSVFGWEADLAPHPAKKQSSILALIDRKFLLPGLFDLALRIGPTGQDLLDPEGRATFELWQFLPINRRGDWRSWPCANGIGCDRARGLIVAQIVDEDAPFANVLAVVDRETLGRVFRHAYQVPTALEPFAVQTEGKIAALEVALGIAERFPRPLVPKHNGAAAILPLRNGPFEGAVVEGMILDMDGKALVFGIEAWSFGDRPAFEDAVQLKPEIIMKARRCVLLNEVAETGLLGPRLAGWLARFGKIPLGTVSGKATWCGGWHRHSSRRPKTNGRRRQQFRRAHSLRSKS